MKRSLFITLCISFLISFTSTRESDVSFIKILKIPLYLECPVNIECADFETAPKPFNYKTFLIKSKKDKKFILDNIAKSKDWVPGGFDSRAKMYIYYESGKVDTLCFCSTTAFYYNGKRKLLSDRKLINFVDSLPYNPRDIDGNY